MSRQDEIEATNKRMDEIYRKTASGSNSAAISGYVHPEIEHWAEEYECAMMHLDDLGAPRKDGENSYSLVGRINKLLELRST